MAVREVHALITKNASIAAATELHAGAAVAVNTSGLLVAADRDDHTRGAFLGILADDTARSGNTQIGIVPVGACWLDSGDASVFNAYNNGLFVSTRRALDHMQDETVTNPSDLVSGASGFQGPRRPAAVFTSPSTVLQTDQFAEYKTADTTGPYAAVDSAFSGGDAFAYGDLLTYGTGANAGKFVKVTDATVTLVVARFDKWADAAQNLMEITLLI
ncbi:MAG: hypothetical protein ACAH95_13925 [Fimbriimonas sp.]